MKQKRRIRWPWFVASILITATLAVPASVYVIPLIVRWQMISNLDSDSPAKRETALKYMLAKAPQDPSLIDAALQRIDLTSADDLRREIAITFLTRFGVMYPQVIRAALDKMGEADDLCGTGSRIDRPLPRSPEPHQMPALDRLRGAIAPPRQRQAL